jgi:hypothetical protein
MDSYGEGGFYRDSKMVSRGMRQKRISSESEKEDRHRYKVVSMPLAIVSCRSFNKQSVLDENMLLLSQINKVFGGNCG